MSLAAYPVLTLGVILLVVLIAIPWGLASFPDALSSIASSEERGTAARVIEVLSALGLTGALVGLVRNPAKRYLKNLGGVLVLVLALLLGGRWANDAAINGTDERWTYGYVLGAGLVLYAVCNPEWWSLAPFYRGRLRHAFATYRDGDKVKAYVGSGSDGREEPSLYQLTGSGPGGPRLVLCAAMNVSGEVARARYGFPAYSFVLAPDQVAYRVPLPGAGSSRTESAAPQKVERLWHRWDSPRLTTMAAVGMSGAALAPGMGRQSLGTTKALLALANVRLGVWLPNPRYASGIQLEESILPKKRSWWPNYPRVRVSYLLRELTGLFDPNDPYVYVTDGGHWDNTGLVETVRTGVDEVVCLDASGVAIDSISALSESIVLASADADIEIRIRFDGVRADATNGLAMRSVGLGTIHYKHHDGDYRVGLLWYGKPVLTEALKTRLLAYREADPRFPTHGTIDQFFDEQRFESYRLLGKAVATGILEARVKLLRAFRTKSYEELNDLRSDWVARELHALLDASEYETLRTRFLEERPGATSDDGVWTGRR